ncbi:Hypothetical Protein FCC1311_088612 [Hondaea fermentalgiana]|uniref:Uncharacterized protein n=1 Tax=Hondaea fermentalgiana TaxID=2315210 RepID=A0A2R5GP29_9STRA|nr:Hypothetical Protein FCC1311_088612 [Hondaea fermentalgiana]|eukprot:GBG32636.1 Hypothetical Protein FCC1311_088612 [Hondaea fermentalgiana]
MGSFDGAAVAALLAGSTKHEYTHKKISKENLADALKKMSDAVGVLFAKADEQQAQLEQEKKLRKELEDSQSVLSRRVLEAEQGLKQANKKMIEQKKDLMREQRKNADLIAELETAREQLREEVSEHETELQRLLRASDRQQSVLQVLKLDVGSAGDVARQALAVAQEAAENAEQTKNEQTSNERPSRRDNRGSGRASGPPRGAGAAALAAGPVDTENLRLSSEQVYCQSVDFATGELGEDLVPLAKLMQALAAKMSTLEKSRGTTADALLDLETEIAKRAFDDEMAVLSTEFKTTCTNLDGLLRSFYEAGVFAEAPPAASISAAVVEAKPPVVPSQSLSVDASNRNGAAQPSEHDRKLAEIRASSQSAPSGAYRVCRGMRDLPQRFEAEVNVLSGVLNATASQLSKMQADIDTKLDADGVDSKIEVKFDEVIEELDRAIASAGADEEEFKRAAQELQDMCTTLSQSKADQSEVLDIRKKLELDARMRDKVEMLQKYMEDKLSRAEADDLVSGKVAKEELGVKLSMLHRRLKAEIGLAIDEHNGVKPWVIGQPLSPHGASPSPKDPLTCLACNRKITPGQMDLLRRAPAMHNAAMNRQQVRSRDAGNNRKMFPVKSKALRPDPRRGHDHVAPFVHDVDSKDWEPLQSPSGLNQADAARGNGSSSLPVLVDRPKTVASLGGTLRRAGPEESHAGPPQTAPSTTAGTSIPPIWPPDDPAAQGAGDHSVPAASENATSSKASPESKQQRPDEGESGPVIEQVRIQTFTF